jgi:Ala-tRNA(Pro) deacylase
MAITARLKWYLDSRDVDYEVVQHLHSGTSVGSARAAGLPTGRVAKCVLLEDERGYLLALLPASCRLSLSAIEDQLHRSLELASERELEEMFPDCEIGAVPPIGEAYNIPMLVDDSLLRLPDVYLEGGDHEGLVHVTRESFQILTGDSAHGRISKPH